MATYNRQKKGYAYKNDDGTSVNGCRNICNAPSIIYGCSIVILVSISFFCLLYVAIFFMQNSYTRRLCFVMSHNDSCYAFCSCIIWIIFMTQLHLRINVEHHTSNILIGILFKLWQELTRARYAKDKNYLDIVRYFFMRLSYFLSAYDNVHIRLCQFVSIFMTLSVHCQLNIWITFINLICLIYGTWIEAVSFIFTNQTPLYMCV
jgi:hypothetical protein